MRIGELAHAAGITITAVRFYERKGLLTPTARAGGQRRYDNAALARLEVIATCQRAGFTLDEIAHLLARDGDPDVFDTFATAKLHDIDARRRRLDDAEHLLRHALTCRCRSTADCTSAPVPLPTARRTPHPAS